MIDRDYCLKVTDFGLSTTLNEKGEKGLLTQTVGSDSYMAPELHERRLYSGKSVDIFAIGIVLFSLKMKNFPFDKAMK